MKLKINGSIYKKPLPEKLQVIVDYLDSLKYGDSRTAKYLIKKFGYKNTSQISHTFRNRGQKDLQSKYCFMLTGVLMIWANPKTIEDLKNGKIKIS